VIFVTFVFKMLIRPNRLPDILILLDKIIAAPAGGQRRWVHIQTDLPVRCALPNLLEGLVPDIAKRRDALARHTAHIYIAVEINQTVRPGRVTGVLVVVTKGISPYAPQPDLGVGSPEGKRIFVRKDEAEDQRAFCNLRGDLRIEHSNVALTHGQDLTQWSSTGMRLIPSAPS
jgi:hypothetical protein